MNPLVSRPVGLLYNFPKGQELLLHAQISAPGGKTSRLSARRIAGGWLKLFQMKEFHPSGGG